MYRNELFDFHLILCCVNGDQQKDERSYLILLSGLEEMKTHRVLLHFHQGV